MNFFFICSFIKLFLSLFLFIFNNKLKYIYLILLLILFYCYFPNNFFIDILFNILLFFNIAIFYINNLSFFKYNISITTIYLFYLLKIINQIKNKFIKTFLALIVLIFYLFIINFTIKYNSYISKLNITKINKNPKNINMNMKVALCISGRIDGNIKELYYSWKKNLLDFYDVDIFMNIDKNNNFIKDFIKPKKYVVFNDLIHKNNNLHKYANLMFYRIYETNKYCNEYQNKNNIKYDLIIRMRTDILLNERLYLENFNENLIYFPFKENISESSNIYSLGVTDQFFIANNNLMNKICNFYLVLENYNFIKCKISEVYLLYYIKKNNIKYSHFEYNWIINHYNNNNIFNNIKFYNRIFWILSKSCFINLY